MSFFANLVHKKTRINPFIVDWHVFTMLIFFFIWAIIKQLLVLEVAGNLHHVSLGLLWHYQTSWLFYAKYVYKK